MTRLQTKNMILEEWDNRSSKLDWLKYEKNMVAILESTELSDTEKVFACKEYLDAFTKRGYFEPAPFTGGIQ